MAIGTTLVIGGIAGGATYAIAKNKNKSNGEAAVAGAVVGATAAVVLPIAFAITLGVLFWAAVAAAVVLPVAGGIYLVNKSRGPKALPPGS